MANSANLVAVVSIICTVLVAPFSRRLGGYLVPFR